MGKRLVGGGMVGKNMRNHRQRAQLKRAGGRSSQEGKPFLLGKQPGQLSMNEGNSRVLASQAEKLLPIC